MNQQKRQTRPPACFFFSGFRDSPKGEELGGFLHGHPVTDETCDQTAGHMEEEEDEGKTNNTVTL